MPPHRILAVDDERDILDSLAKLLPMLLDDVEVSRASSGHDALRALKEGDFALVISDYKMPKMDGLEFIKRARKAHPDLKAVLMTAYPDANLAAEAKRRAGVVAFLPKPFDMEQLVSVIQDNLT